MSRRLLTSAALLGSAFAAALGGTTIVNAAVDSGSNGPTRVQRVNPQLSEHFAALRQSVSPDPTARQSQKDPLMADTGVNPDLGRTTTKLGSDVAVITPSTKGLCIGTEQLGILTCGDTAHALKGEVIGSVICSKQVPADKVEVLGAFPDEVTEVTAAMSDGSTATIPLTQNTLVRQYDKSAPVPLRLSYSIGGSPHSVTTSLPKGGELGCGANVPGA